jgi:parallel beta-helix repeat protein
MPRIIGNRITGSGDKGISIGEGSAPFVFNNIITNCAIGIEVKDRSRPVVLHNQLTGNRTGLRERRKNWRYGGGAWPVIARTRFERSPERWDQDNFSRTTVADVVGLDAVPLAGRDDGLSLAWLYAAWGIRPEGKPGPGLLEKWHAIPPLRPVEEASFVDDFGLVSDGWLPAGGLFRAEKRHDALVLEARREPGSATKRVDWNLADGGTLVLEASGEALSQARVVVLGERGSVAKPVTVAGVLNRSRLTEVALPPGRYHAVRLDLAPVPGLTRIDPVTGLTELQPARLDLRRYAVYPITP